MKPTTAATQQALPFFAEQTPVFAGFSGRANDELIARLMALPKRFATCWLHGGAGAGKTHLLKATINTQRGYGYRSRYVDAANDPFNRVAETIGADQCVAIDNVDAWLGRRPAEELLFALYQDLLQREGQLLLGARASPVHTDFVLQDLASRLRAAEIFEVHALDESGVRHLLQRRARERGLLLSRTVLDFWLTRRNRSVVALLADLERLDAAAWQAKHRLTVPFLKAVLEL
ncbi:MAG: hypothetical protein H6993_00585 [Pseudomonadales bacterium]|nr:hypothetical protein [Pseudomonadales bacterium]MCP5182420.1 hypothetical protein [Pseudomonadales bacterium]